MKKITIKDIAKETGVSISTVSNVLNNRPNKASQQTKDRIKAVVAKYNYSLNLNARSMVTKESGMIAVLYYTEKKEIDFSDPFLSDILTGVELTSKAHHKFILVHGFSEIKDIRSIQQNWSFDGYIVIGAIQSIHNQLDEILTAPVVFIDTYTKQRKTSSKYSRFYIHSNDFEISYFATKYLIEKGHQDIAVFSPTLGKDSMGVIHERFTGYSRALEQSGINIQENLFFDETEFQRVIKDADKYTAVLANSDFLAGKLLSLWKQNNIEHKSIIGFDNSFFSEYLDPQLTTVDLEQKQKGIKAVEVLCGTSGTSEIITKKYFIQGKLIERNSVEIFYSSKKE